MKNTSSILLVVQFFFVSVLLGTESDANLTALPIQSVGQTEMEVPSMASMNPKKSNLTAIVGSQTGEDGVENAFIKTLSVEKNNEPKFAELVDESGKSQFSEATHLAWNQTGTILYVTGHYVGSIQFSNNLKLENFDEDTKEAVSSTFLLQLSVSENNMDPLQLLDLGEGEPSLLKVTSKEGKDDVFAMTQSGSLMQIEFFTKEDSTDVIIFNEIPHQLNQIHDFAVGENLLFLVGENEKKENVIQSVKFDGALQKEINATENLDFHKIAAIGDEQIVVSGLLNNQSFISKRSGSELDEQWLIDSDSVKVKGLKIENQTILAMIQTINQEGEKSKTEFIAFDEDNGSVLASESLGNKIAFINGLCMESLTICGVSQVINETHENLVQSLIFNREENDDDEDENGGKDGDGEEDDENDDKDPPSVNPPSTNPTLPYVDFRVELEKTLKNIALLESQLKERSSTLSILNAESYQEQVQVNRLERNRQEKANQLEKCQTENQQLLEKIEAEQLALQKIEEEEKRLDLEIQEIEAVNQNLTYEIQNTEFGNEKLLAEISKVENKLGTPHIKGWHYTDDRGWIWTDEENYPMIYSNRSESWMIYDLGTSNPWWYFDFTSSEWTEWK